MAKVKFNVKIDTIKCKLIDDNAERALLQTAEALHTEVVQAGVMPFKTGHMQDECTFVDPVNEHHVRLVTETEYVVRLYMHPEYNFSKKTNKDAQGRWLHRWITGSEKNWCKKTFAKFLRGGGKP